MRKQNNIDVRRILVCADEVMRFEQAASLSIIIAMPMQNDAA